MESKNTKSDSADTKNNQPVAESPSPSSPLPAITETPLEPEDYMIEPVIV